MLCRRGSIKKEDLGAIRILETVTEFEVAARVASRFAARIRRPDKQDSIRIEALQNASRDTAREQGERPYGKEEKRAKKTTFDRQTGYDTRKRHHDEPAHAGRPRAESGAPARATFGKNSKKKFRGSPGNDTPTPRKKHRGRP